jgi:hypothetical protein
MLYGMDKNSQVMYAVLWNRRVPVPTFEKVMVPVPVPVPTPYLDHKNQIFKKKFGIFFAFLHSRLF